MESIKVIDYLNKRPVTFKASMTVAEAAERLLLSHQSGGPVLNDDKQVIGFLSEQDCIKRMLHDTYLSESYFTVKEIMSTHTLTVNTEHSIFELAQEMTENKPKIYPVVDKDNHLLGTIGRTEVLKAIDIHLHAIYEKGHGRFV
ncbi:hypothetical protein PULV_a3536 [Pseudoalteromonas ulvae UL12]|uniref:CBS domain-containing protein n=1 Tax=Pseudoalteromonas ulvae TaxID=107327 RepID=A0A244CTJ1_PSEDV|nr:CBS domain-containing protein [Pseudoalteromonas ulvae]MBE0363342.1 hypothetical protein [Pseudoalteromonas ulvae UL12]OUL58942.1 CBS domain-containing protein [Pseudoalteromonas ulvae]